MVNPSARAVVSLGVVSRIVRPPLGGHVLQLASVDDGLKAYVNS